MTYVLGVDPGPVVGIVGFNVAGSRPGQVVDLVVVQASWNVFDDVLIALARPDLVLAVEQFVPSRLSPRGNDPGSARAARGVVQRCERFMTEHHLDGHLRSAAAVKPWATDERLAAAGLLEPTKGMRHARDAARHALYCAVRDFGLPDPLSRRGRGA